MNAKQRGNSKPRADQSSWHLVIGSIWRWMGYRIYRTAQVTPRSWRPVALQHHHLPAATLNAQRHHQQRLQIQHHHRGTLHHDFTITVLPQPALPIPAQMPLRHTLQRLPAHNCAPDKQRRRYSGTPPPRSPQTRAMPPPQHQYQRCAPYQRTPYPLHHTRCMHWVRHGRARP